MTWAYIVIAVMVLLSAYFSASEISFNSANKMRLRRAADEGSRTARVAYNIADKFTTSLSAILIGNNLANIAVSTCTTLIVMNLFEPEMAGMASFIATIAVTVVILICGEIVPKVLAKQHADVVARIVAIPTRVLTVLVSPIVAVVMALLFVLRKLWGKDCGEDDPTVTEQELSSIIETVEEEGVIDEDQGELLQSALEFHDITVEKIMTPRINMTAFDIDDQDALHALVSDAAQFSRIPVYEDSVDNIIGVMSLNRYYKACVGGQTPNVRELLMKPLKLHKTMKLPAALARLREQKMHLAIVIDEFGGTLGVVTMEDILEELVGDIWDDTDVIVTECYPTGENTYEVSGEMNIEDCFDEVDFKCPEDFSCEYTTMGGWAVEMLEANPHVGDSFSYENLFVIVSDMDEERVTKLTLFVKPQPKDEDEEEL
ncbi:MAG: HlyC/CorC family transporter [Clostridia bacterium]|nr:HlyC/CorC family transporter [Clostridia bacterium]MBR3863467.1 HlyC/CorC family transporter [Clostridia bacterium]